MRHLHRYTFLMALFVAVTVASSTIHKGYGHSLEARSAQAAEILYYGRTHHAYTPHTYALVEEAITSLMQAEPSDFTPSTQQSVLDFVIALRRFYPGRNCQRDFYDAMAPHFFKDMILGTDALADAYVNHPETYDLLMATLTPEAEDQDNHLNTLVDHVHGYVGRRGNSWEGGRSIFEDYDYRHYVTRLLNLTTPLITCADIVTEILVNDTYKGWTILGMGPHVRYFQGVQGNTYTANQAKPLNLKACALTEGLCDFYSPELRGFEPEAGKNYVFAKYLFDQNVHINQLKKIRIKGVTDYINFILVREASEFDTQKSLPFHIKNHTNQYLYHSRSIKEFWQQHQKFQAAYPAKKDTYDRDFHIPGAFYLYSFPLDAPPDKPLRGNYNPHSFEAPAANNLERLLCDFVVPLEAAAYQSVPQAQYALAIMYQIIGTARQKEESQRLMQRAKNQGYFQEESFNAPWMKNFLDPSQLRASTLKEARNFFLDKLPYPQARELLLGLIDHTKKLKIYGITRYISAAKEEILSSLYKD